MTSREVSKVRLVKCPKCRRLLAELAELPVYECGGCGTVLQAKVRKNDANSTRVDLPETNFTPSKELKNATEEKGSSSTSQNEFRKDQLEVLNLPTEVSSSAELTNSEIADSSKIQLPTAAADEHMDHSHEITVPGFDSVISTVTSKTTEKMNSDSDLSGALDDMHAPTARSVSSCDESHETITKVLYPPAEVHRTFKDAEFAGVQEHLMRERGKFPMIDLTGRNAEIQDEARSSFSSDVPDYIIKYSEWSRNEPVKHPRHSHQMRSDDNQSLTTVPFYLKNESPSSHWHDEFQGTSSLCSPENPSNYSQEKIRLLRMVYKLQDQLDKTYVSGKQVNPNIPTRGAYYSHESSQEDPYNEVGSFGHSRYPRKYEESEEWSYYSRSSQMPFSGEAINWERFQADHQYSHCHCCNIEPGAGRIHLAHNCYSGQSSRPPVYQPWMDSKVPSRDSYSKSDDLSYRADEGRKFHSREKIHVAKKHYRPIASGAPFISCYHCLNPLQLPADFLLFKRRCHKLRCGACTKVLKFSLVNNNHILPLSYVDSFAPAEERKIPAFFKQSPINRYKNSVNSDEEAGPSSKSLSVKKLAHGIDETARKTGSPLHRLMGYTSASELLRNRSS